MIQRLQSIFLLLASGSCFGLFGTDVADSEVKLTDSDLFSDGSFNVFDHPVIIAAFAVAGVLFLANIFLFRNRPLQMKLATAGIFATGIGIGWGVFEYFTDTAASIPDAISPDFGLAFPVLIIVFGALANKYIKKDEKLVRSADRLR
ncbi:DUF4293 domain-containing protein [Neolewinella persica]|uniref:DUF4293 domain-containing protein n=1 Tax=Neolewinella persica TaxID=70998 RepID=UPI00036DA26C|nr:DUF4293 domain-containing protein [Neolewinella persica]